MRQPAAAFLTLLLAATAPPAAAQGGDVGSLTRPGAIIEQGVGDRSALGVSQRRVEPGNARHSFEARLSVADFGHAWSPLNPNSPIVTDRSTGLAHSQAFRYNSPGVRALLDRPDYARTRHGDILIIPANTVFQLTLDRPAPTRPAPPPHQNFVDLRLDLRPDPAAFNASALPGNPPAPGSIPANSPETIPNPGAAGFDTRHWRYPQAAQATQAPHHVPVRRAAAPPVAAPQAEPAPAEPTPADAPEARD